METYLNVLVVSDDSAVRSLLLGAIKEAGPEIECITASHGAQAVQWLRASAHFVPDLIFWEIGVRFASAADQLSDIRNDAKLVSIPMVVYTTTKELAEVASPASMGEVHFVNKRSTNNELYNLVTHALHDVMPA